MKGGLSLGTKEAARQVEETAKAKAQRCGQHRGMQTLDGRGGAETWMPVWERGLTARSPSLI